MAPLICSDISPTQVELYQYKIGVEYSDKPIILSVSDIEVFEKIVHLAAMLAGGRKNLVAKPNIILNLGVMSPLFLPKELCEIIVAASKLGIPFCIYSSSTAGGTSPVTLSGTLAGNHAENIAAIALAKLINPEIDILYSNYSKSFDMQHSDVLVGNPEYGLLKAAAVQLGNYIGLPTCTGALLSDSPQLDIQSGIEIMGSSFLPILSGVDLSSGMGMLSKLMVFSLEALVVDAECIAYFNRIMQGINCDGTHLSADIYCQVKPMGEFLTQKHTFDYFKSEMWYSKLCNRKSFSTWHAESSENSLRNNVQKLIRRTLREYVSPSLPESFITEFENIRGNGVKP
jgi:trimethylamine--corrinoid protein Co-methyltransferase